MADDQEAIAEAQATVIRSLKNLKNSIVQAGDSVSYLNAEVEITMSLFLSNSTYDRGLTVVLTVIGVGRKNEDTRANCRGNLPAIQSVSF